MLQCGTIDPKWGFRLTSLANGNHSKVASYLIMDLTKKKKDQ